MLDLKIAHIGINSENESVVKTISNVFSTIMDTDITKESDKRIFAGTMFEVMKYNGVCDNGHIAIKTTNVDRAVYYLSKRGIEFDLSTAMYNDDGSMKFIYIKNQIGGVGGHLVL